MGCSFTENGRLSPAVAHVSIRKGTSLGGSLLSCFRKWRLYLEKKILSCSTWLPQCVIVSSCPILMNFENKMPCATREQICLAGSLVYARSCQWYLGPSGARVRLPIGLLFVSAVSSTGNFSAIFYEPKNIREAGRMMDWLCLWVSVILQSQGMLMTSWMSIPSAMC